MFSPPSLGERRLANFNFWENVWQRTHEGCRIEKKQPRGSEHFSLSAGDLCTGLASTVYPPEVPDLMR